MNDYAIALFVHIVGALGMFVTLGLEWTGLSQIRSAQDPVQIRVWMGMLKTTAKLGFPTMLATVVSGVYLMWRVWGGTPWLTATIGAVVVVSLLTTMLTRPRMEALGKTLAAQKGTIPPAFHSLANQPLLWILLQTRVAIALAIILLKTMKPDWVGSLLILGIAAVFGIATALPLPRRARAQAGSAD